MKTNTRTCSLLFFIIALLLSACGNAAPLDSPPATGLTPPAISFNINDGTCPDLEIQAGSTVGWKNTGKKEFMLQSELQNDGSRLFDSGVLQPGDEFAMSFPTPGIIYYQCSGDGSVYRTITVIGPNPQPTSLAAQLGSGVAHSCLLTEAGKVFCWGQDGKPDGQLAVEQWGKPFEVEGLEAISLSAGWIHTCVATREGSVKCWGKNTDGQLGNGTESDSLLPVTVAGLENVAAVSAGPAHTCALTFSGDVYCWGANDQGQLGDGTTNKHLQPVLVNGLSSPAASIATGLAYTCAVLVDGQVECWGDFDFINGEQRHRVRLSPEAIPNLEGDTEKIAAGDYHICALTKAREIKCEGNFFPTSSSPFSKPAEIFGGQQGHIQDILAETDFTCVATDSGEVYCWGDNYFDQLGDGTFATPAEPVKVARAGNEVMALGGGHYTACALSADGSVSCWGDTSFGQIGDGTARWK